ncbi:hypothetical protein MHU86_7263 [Fragilaria crotonensis]|nr:hypothetical protein MHU86_7263 [Fragilaria crotonensis]
MMTVFYSCVGANYQEKFKAFIDAGGAVGVAGKNNKQVDKHVAGGKIAGSGLRGSGQLDGFVVRVSNAEMEMTEWINYLVMKNMAVSLVDCPLTPRISKLKAVSSKTVRKHILSLVMLVRQQVQLCLPNKFAIIFDGWTEGIDHYVGVWASYNMPVDSTSKDAYSRGDKETPVQSLLSIKPLLADGIEGMTAHDHLTHITRVLQLYGKEASNVICLVGDNCKVNQSLARAMSVPLIGCGSHKFNFAVNKWIREQPNLTDIIAKVAAVMKKASTLKVAAKLAQLNALVELLELLPTPVDVNTLSRGFQSLERFQSVTKMLQRDGIPFVEVRGLFDVILRDYPDMAHHLGKDSSLVINKDFESGVMALSKGVPLQLAQQAAVVGLFKGRTWRRC